MRNISYYMTKYQNHSGLPFPLKSKTQPLKPIHNLVYGSLDLLSG